MKQTYSITQEQWDALTAYVINNGRTWKSKLSSDWMRAYYPSVNDRYHAPLQQLRNDSAFDLKSFNITTGTCVRSEY